MLENGIYFTILGLVVLDDIRFPDQRPLNNILGSSGVYARLFLPPPQTESVGWMLHIEHDFLESTQRQLERWSVSLYTDKEADNLSTRGLLEYGDTTFAPKKFRYTTPVLTVQERSLANTELLKSKAYHYLETPQTIATRVSDLHSLLQKVIPALPEKPLVIWEPATLSCKPDNLQACLDAVAFVDVFSPNHLELLSLFGEPASSTTIDKEKIKSLVTIFIDRGIGRDGTGVAIIRAGEHGCCILRIPNINPVWLPTFYNNSSSSSEKMLGQNSMFADPTGARNAFLGPYAVGYIKTNSAYFALEQVGVPELSTVEGKEEELWNGNSVLSRFREYVHSLESLEVTTIPEGTWQ
ncbi:hypothetical protein BGW36DRAFT_398115 [Talaromyces proteolyticus]|uniref:Uncharacterized protein n=1 Tax=Talaromyces proteolyticus TaxID=1131652 RepID=A0AAD4Q076_9EURO|nr:uncharacterized protein BGW36DRAFT_398115 [Talaromyces proteolyticus]KAH8696623.1 hypothetical protein BGW36DRAFT_398115 [Talaromyces proteolyticus]